MEPLKDNDDASAQAKGEATAAQPQGAAPSRDIGTVASATAGNSCETATNSSCDEATATEDGSASECPNLEGTCIAFPAPDQGDCCIDEETGRVEKKEEEKAEDSVVKEKRRDCTRSENHDLTNSVPVQFADNQAKKRPLKIADIGKIYNISCIKHRRCFLQSQASSTAGPGAYSVHTANTASISNTDQDNLEGQRTTTRGQNPVEEDPPLRFWRDESTASRTSASAASPSRNSHLIEATLVNETINHLYPPIAVNTYGRPRRLSSSQRQHRYSFAQQQKEVESDRDGESSLSGVPEATALSSNGVVVFCLQSRKGHLLVLGAVIMVVSLLVGLVLGLTGGAGDEESSSNTTAAADAPLVNETAAAPSTTVAPTLSPSFAPTTSFGAAVLPQFLQESLLDPTSPQSSAMAWMLEDPQLNEIQLERKLQRYAMITFYYSTMGENWVDSTSWLDYHVSECQWFSGVQEGKRPCNADSQLIHFVLPANDLKGTLPLELELLSHLKTLDLSSNPVLTGSIPSALWQGNLAKNLRSLDLSHSSLTGRLPADALASLTKLTSLNLEGASLLTGGLPTQIGLLSSSLEDMTLSFTGLSGTLPSQVGQLAKLTSLKMRHCQMTGMYPTDLGQLSRLEYLDLGENRMSGSSIPSEIGLLTSLDLIALDNSSLSGTIPSQVGWMKRLRSFNVFANRLSGSIPTQLMQVSGLEYLFLNQNRLRGTVPSEIGKLSELLWLVAWDNQLTGTLPLELQSNTALTLLSLATNPLTGTIPTELFTLTSLERLFLGWSFVSGVIPTEVRQLSNLVGLYLNAANLQGTVPTEIGYLRHLTDLWINSHSVGLTGTLPSELGMIKLLTEFKANNNRLNGTLPLEIGQLTSLQTLNLSHNEFSGSLPAVIGEMGQLGIIDLQDNFLTGLIPTEELASCLFLRELYLQNNSLSGELPDELCDLNALMFDCSPALCGCQCTCQGG